MNMINKSIRLEIYSKPTLCFPFLIFLITNLLPIVEKYLIFIFYLMIDQINRDFES